MRPLLVLVALLLATGLAGADEPIPAPILDPDADLPARPLAWWNGKDGRLGSPAGPLVTSAWGPAQVHVLDGDGAGPVRVVISGDGVRLVALVAAGSLATVAATDTFLPARAGASRGHGVPGVWVFAGTALVSAGGGRYQVQSGDVKATAFVSDRAAVSRFFQPTHNQPLWQSSPVRVRTATALLDAPGGKPFGQLRADAGVRVVRGTARDRHVLVRHTARELVAVGWVRRADVRFPGDPEDEDEDGELDGIGGIEGGIDMSAGGRALRHGTLLHDGPRGRVVGVARTSILGAGVRVLAERDGWTELQPAGDVTARVWAPSAALVPRQAVPPPPPPLPPRGGPRPVDMTAFQALRTAGEPVSLSPHSAALRAAGIVEARAGVKMCLAADGSVTEATTIEPSGLPALDAALLTTVRAWRFRPHPHGAVCSRLLYHLSL